MNISWERVRRITPARVIKKLKRFLAQHAGLSTPAVAQDVRAMWRVPKEITGKRLLDAGYGNIRILRQYDAAHELGALFAVAERLS